MDVRNKCKKWMLETVNQHFWDDIDAVRSIEMQWETSILVNRGQESRLLLAGFS